MLQRHARALQRELSQIRMRTDVAAVAVSRELVDGVERFGELLFVEREPDAQALLVRLGAGDHIDKHAVLGDDVKHTGGK